MVKNSFQGSVFCGLLAPEGYCKYRSLSLPGVKSTRSLFLLLSYIKQMTCCFGTSIAASILENPLKVGLLHKVKLISSGRRQDED